MHVQFGIKWPWQSYTPPPLVLTQNAVELGADTFEQMHMPVKKELGLNGEAIPWYTNQPNEINEEVCDELKKRYPDKVGLIMSFDGEPPRLMLYEDVPFLDKKQNDDS